MKNYSIDFMQTENQEITTCILTYKGQQFVGEAYRHSDDKPRKLLGYELAEIRATRDYLRFVRDWEVRPALRSLKQLYYSINHSKHFNPKSYEAKMLGRQIKIHEEELQGIKEYLEGLQRKEEYLIAQSDKIEKKSE